MSAPLALTFDDGPDPAGTPAVLDALAATGVRATFFVLAGRAAAQPQMIERMRSDRHEIELHGDAHLRHSRAGRRRIRRDTTKALEKLDRFGVRPIRWRTPWGDRAPWTAQLAAAHGLDLVGWDVDPEDWAGPTAERMLERIVPELRAGATVLLHDGVGPGARRDSCAETAALIPPLVAAARAAGLEPGPFGALRPTAPVLR